MTPVKRKIKDIILHKGPLSIADFMTVALTDSEHGYYRKKMPLGSKGDFVTSPDISQIFGEIIGIWILALFKKKEKFKEIQIVDLGGGRGTLLSDIKRVLGAKVTNYIFLDINNKLIKIQKKNIKESLHFRRLEDIPEKPTIFIGNEFLDTFPVNQFIKNKDCWREVCIDHGDQELIFCHKKTKLSKLLDSQKLINIKINAIIEINFRSRNFIKKISSFIKRNNGGALFFDYGYTDGYGDTLQAIKGSEFVNPLNEPGLADITSHVDFRDIITQAKDSMVDVWGPDTQGSFLIKMGAIERLKSLERMSDVKTKKELRLGLSRLIDEDKMGKLFKVFAITSNKFPSPEGFTCGTTST